MNFKLKLLKPLAVLVSLVLIGGGFSGCDEDTGNPGQTGFEFPSVNAEACAAEREALEAEVAGEETLVDDPEEMLGLDTADYTSYYSGGYYLDDLATHPGCEPRSSYATNVGVWTAFLDTNSASVVDGEPIAISGYDCAGKQYDDSNVDPDKAIVILVHGNSDSPDAWEEYLDSQAGNVQSNTNFDYTVDSEVRPMLASLLMDEGHRVFAADMRVDLISTALTGGSGENAGLNIDHGWAVPILQSLIKSVMNEYPDQQVSLVGHSLGVTVIRDALRRLWIEHRDGVDGAVNPFPRLDDVVLASGANHGVSDIVVNCDEGIDQARTGGAGHMRKTVVCEMGGLEDHEPTYFNRRLNGPSDVHALPCADAFSAFGEDDQCESNQVEYSVIVMQDEEEGVYQDEFVNEVSANFNYSECYAGVTTTLTDVDTSRYFFGGAFAAHYGAVRSAVAVEAIVTELGD